jgi:hypothetical protein
MKKIQYSYLPAGSTMPGDNSKNNPQQKSIVQNAGATPPNDETVAKLNAIAREYPFCAYMRPKDTRML